MSKFQEYLEITLDKQLSEELAENFVKLGL